MRFPEPLRRGRLLSRYKRFFADVALDTGEIVTAHCPNPGAMLGLNETGQTAWISPASGAHRKLAWTLELMEQDGVLAGVNTHRPNPLAEEAIRAEAIPELLGYPTLRREVRYGEASRIDFLLQATGRPDCWLEIKNCHFRRSPGLAEFPDCVAARSARHLRELTACVVAGDRAVQLFVIQREDCEAFDTAADLDPVYAAALLRAADAGVEVLCYACEVTTQAVGLHRRIPWTPRPPA